jgi:hypothetical protein
VTFRPTLLLVSITIVVALPRGGEFDAVNGYIIEGEFRRASWLPADGLNNNNA